MALRYKVLEKFSREALEDAASRAYNVKHKYGGYVCEKGDCVMAVILRHDLLKLDPDNHQPSPLRIASLLGIDYDEDDDEPQEVTELVEITRMNDLGKLATPEAVRALLLGEEA